MKRFTLESLVLAFAFVLCGGPVATAASAMDDLSWFGNTGATAHPVKDSTYSGYWWWPTVPESNNSDSELWGNRGVVYNMYSPKVPPPPPAPPTPTPAQPPEAKRSVPVFNHVLFDFDKSNLRPAGQAEVAKVAAILKDYPSDTVTIEGHTCDLNGSGDPNYNVKLGQRRADAVAKALASEGVDSSRISTVSKGENDPAVPNTSSANREQNRRAVFVIKIGS